MNNKGTSQSLACAMSHHEICKINTGRNITVVPNSIDFSDTLKFGTLGAEIVCGIGPNSTGDFTDIMKSGQCVAGAVGAAAVKLVITS
jgi:hypothetical protein